MSDFLKAIFYTVITILLLLISYIIIHELDENEELSPLRYVDDDNIITENYSINNSHQYSGSMYVGNYKQNITEINNTGSWNINISITCFFDDDVENRGYLNLTLYNNDSILYRMITNTSKNIQITENITGNNMTAVFVGVGSDTFSDSDMADYYIVEVDYTYIG